MSEKEGSLYRNGCCKCEIGDVIVPFTVTADLLEERIREKIKESRFIPNGMLEEMVFLKKEGFHIPVLEEKIEYEAQWAVSGGIDRKIPCIAYRNVTEYKNGKRTTKRERYTEFKIETEWQKPESGKQNGIIYFKVYAGKNPKNIPLDPTRWVGNLNGVEIDEATLQNPDFARWGSDFDDTFISESEIWDLHRHRIHYLIVNDVKSDIYERFSRHYNHLRGVDVNSVRVLGTRMQKIYVPVCHAIFCYMDKEYHYWCSGDMGTIHHDEMDDLPKDEKKLDEYNSLHTEIDHLKTEIDHLNTEIERLEEEKKELIIKSGGIPIVAAVGGLGAVAFFGGFSISFVPGLIAVAIAFIFSGVKGKFISEDFEKRKAAIKRKSDLLKRKIDLLKKKSEELAIGHVVSDMAEDRLGKEVDTHKTEIGILKSVIDRKDILVIVSIIVFLINFAGLLGWQKDKFQAHKQSGMSGALVMPERKKSDGQPFPEAGIDKVSKIVSIDSTQNRSSVSQMAITADMGEQDIQKLNAVEGTLEIFCNSGSIVFNDKSFMEYACKAKNDLFEGVRQLGVNKQEGIRKLMDVEGALDGFCRNGELYFVEELGEECIEKAINAREDLLSILFHLGWCYGKKDQAMYEREWHECTRDSIEY